MKPSFILAVLFLSIASRASTGTTVCDALSWRGDYDSKRECLRIIRDSVFDSGAEDICREVVTRGFPGSALMCLRAAKDKTYSSTEISNCEYYNTVNDPASVMSCMTYAGQAN